MTDPGPTQPELTLEEQISAAVREAAVAKLARPRDPERVSAAVAEVERLRALRDG